MKDIKAIYINLPMKSEVYEVGGSVSLYDERIITKIRDNSIETEQNTIPLIEVIVGKNEVAREIINTPMTIYYVGSGE